MLIRRNTKAFKTILEIIEACHPRADREKFIRLYITKAGHTIEDRINIEGVEGNAGLLYDMNYEAVLSNLQSPNHQLQVSDEIRGIYFFHTTSNKAWDETPFEFDDAVKKEFANLPELPVTRKKEKAEKYTIPVAKQHKAPLQPRQKVKTTARKESKAVEKEPRQPDFKLKRKIYFTDLEKVIIHQPKLTKRDVLAYYNHIAEYILPYLKDRPYSVNAYSGAARTTVINAEEFINRDEDNKPEWLQTIDSKKTKKEVFVCNDKEHLLWNVELGCLQFNASHANVKSPDSPDYIVIGIDSPEHQLTKAIDAAHAAYEILNGLDLPSFIKTDGKSGFHIYISLNTPNNFQTSSAIAEIIAKLIRLKIPDLTSLQGTDDHSYGKVTIDHLMNAENCKIIAPYSLVSGESAIIATPLRWEEVKEGLRSEDYTPETIFKRLRQEGDPFESMLRKKQNADALLKRLRENYSFLIS